MVEKFTSKSLTSKFFTLRSKRWAAVLPPAALAFALLLPLIVHAADTSALRPPKGAKVAIVAFGDLQCSDCAAAEPLLLEASAKYNVPLVRMDFPLPKHNWIFDAHVLARYFDSINKDSVNKPDAKGLPLGEQFRRWVFTNQDSIKKENLRGMAERFADQHDVPLPENVDPTGRLAKLVQADYKIGQQAGVIHTPTVFVVSLHRRGEPFIEVLDRDRLFAMIEELQAAEK